MVKIFASLKELMNFINLFETPVYVEDENNYVNFINNSFINFFNVSSNEKQLKIDDLFHFSEIKVNKKNHSEELTFKIVEFINPEIKKYKFRDFAFNCFVEEPNKNYLVHFLLDETGLLSEIKFLQKEKILFDNLLRLTSDAIYFKDKNGIYVLVNKNYCSKIELNENDILNKSPVDLISYSNLTESMVEDSEVLNNKKIIFNKLEKVLLKNGEHHWYLTSKFPILNEKNNVIGLFSISKDITNQKNIEIENERLINFQKLISNVSTIFLKNTYSNFNKALVNVLKEIYNFFNAFYIAVYQLNEKENIYEKISEYPVTPIKISLNNISYYKKWYDKLSKGEFIFEDKNDISENEKDYFEKNKVHKLYLIPLFNFSTFTGFIVIHLSLQGNTWGKDFPNMINILSEIISNSFSNNEAEKYRIEAEEEMLKLLRAVNQSNDAILILDNNLKIEYVNNIYTSITGLPFEELLGQYPTFLTNEINIKWNVKDVIPSLRKGLPANAIFQGKKNDGNSYWGQLSISPIKNFHDEITNYLVLIEDITEKIIADTRREVSQKLESIGQLAAGIAHEINTPMQYIGDNNKFVETSLSNLNLFIKELLNELESRSNLCEDVTAKIKALKEKFDIEFLLEETPLALKQSEEGIKRVTTIIKAMKDFAHPGDKQMAYADINRGIEVTATISKNEWKYYSDLNLELDPNLPLVYCLIDEINQVILNMIINSSHAIQEKYKDSKEKLGLIKISTTQEENYAVINISDNGTGINPNIINRIYDPFFTTKEVGKGTGQGLSIAHDIIVNKHKGFINVKSELGLGTTFTIKLPIKGKSNE